MLLSLRRLEQGRRVIACRLPQIITRNACQKPTIVPVVDGPSQLAIKKPSESPPRPLPHEWHKINTHQFCIQNVKKYDRENYLAALCIKDNVLRRIVFALRAFNVELALVRDLTTDSDRAKIRLLFWSKLIDEILKRNKEDIPDISKDLAYYKQTPVAKELLDLFYLVDVDHRIQRQLRNLVGARLSSKVLGYKQFENYEELELYCYTSNSPVYHIAYRLDLQIHNSWHTNEKMNEYLNDMSETLGIVQGLTNVIRGIPYNSTKNCCYIPKDILSEFHLTNRHFVGKKVDGNEIKPVIKKIATIIQEKLDTVHEDNRFIPKYYRGLFLPRVAIQSYLNKLKKCDHNVFDPKVLRRNDLLPLSMKLASIHHRMPIL